MTTGRRRPAPGRNIEIAKIHIAATALGLMQPGDDSLYREMLLNVAGVESAADLGAAGRAKVIAHLKSIGWEDKAPSRRRTGSPQSRLIHHLWNSLASAGHVHDGSDTALRSFVDAQSKRYNPAGVGYSAPELLPPRVAARIIEHLKQWCERTGTAY